jgi:Bacterial Ig-like domain (group 3)
MRRLFRSAAMVATATVASGTLIAGLAGTAHAATTPPWEPIANPPEAGGLTFYNSSGQVITGGNISDNPIATYIQGNTVLQASPSLVDFDGYTPTQNGVPVSSPGNWNGVSFGSSNLPSAAPGALGSSSLPVYTGQSYSLSQLTTAQPNTDTSTTDGYAGIYVLRLRTFQSGHGTTSSYDVADISVNSSTGAWTVVYTPLATTTTTLTVQPSSPQTSGTSVTLNAAVTDPSAPGTVQFFSGSTPIGSAVTVTNGAAQLVTTALPVGNPDSLTAVYTPTTGAAFSGSTSNTVSYVINAPPADTTATALSVNPTTAAADTSVALTASVTDTTASGTPPLNGGGSVTFYDNGAVTTGAITGSSTPLGTIPVSSVGTAVLNYSLFSQGAHNIVAQFAPTGAYDSSTSGNVLFTATAPLYTADPQNLQAEIPAGTLTITTPYGPGHALDLGTATLNTSGGEFTATAPFGTVGNGGVTITDTGIGNADWTASAQVTNFTGPGGASINGQNLTFTHVLPTYIPGNSYQASGTGTIPVQTNDITNSPPGGYPYGALATGADGLYGAAHAFADTTTPGGGEVNIFGTLTLNAPTSTPSGTYTATLTFTIV